MLQEAVIALLMKAEATDATYHVWLKRKEGQTLWTLIKYLETRLHIFDTRYSTLILNIEYWRLLTGIISYTYRIYTTDIITNTTWHPWQLRGVATRSKSDAS